MALAAIAGWLPAAPFAAPSQANDNQASSNSALTPTRSPTHSFPTERGLLSVCEEAPLNHLRGAVSRAVCTTTAEEFDLRRLRVGAEAGGLVTLRALEALGREADAMAEVAPHMHVVRSHGSLIENTGSMHCRLLLSDPCSGDLSAHLLATPTSTIMGGLTVHRLATDEATEIGQQVAFGIAHLHSHGIVCGPGLTSRGILKGLDGFWKVGDLSGCQRLPAQASEWQASSSSKAVPPEISRAALDEITEAADIWMFGRLLAEIAIEGCSESSPSGSKPLDTSGRDEPLASSEDLLQPLLARLWLLLHWLLTADPSERPSAGEIAALLGKTLAYMTPDEILGDMPAVARESALATAMAAVRQFAIEAASTADISGPARGDLIDRLAGAPLEEVQAALAETTGADDLMRLCENCGLEQHEPVDSAVSSKPASTKAISAGARTSSSDEVSTDAESWREAEAEGDVVSVDSDTSPVPSTTSKCTQDAIVKGLAPELPDLIEF